jgi:hypothetical protein
MVEDAFNPAFREVIEWTDAWQDHAEDLVSPRTLLIGDSIARDYYPFVRDALAGRYRADRFCTSRFAGDPFFNDEVGRYIRLCPYSVIHVNHGLHGRTYSAKAYQAALDGLIRAALDSCQRVIVAASTPVGLKETPDDPDPSRTAQVIERNAIAKAISRKYNVYYNDLYAAVNGVMGLKNVGDGTHFRHEGCDILGAKVADAILTR